MKMNLKAEANNTNAEDLECKVMDILEADNGKTFEEKRAEALSYLQGKENALLAEKLVEIATNDEIGKRIKAQFWRQGICTAGGQKIILRKPEEKDKQAFLKLQIENAISRSFFREESYRNLIWMEHIEHKSLMCTIESKDEYIGYCGIKNVTAEYWEISIELLKKWQNQGIGTNAVILLLDNVRNRLGVMDFRIRISPDNYASQALFEKLGAVPNGLSEFLLHGAKELTKWEEENLEKIDDRLIETANNFCVEPRKLLSHVLEYKLAWKEHVLYWA